MSVESFVQVVFCFVLWGGGVCLFVVCFCFLVFVCLFFRIVFFVFAVQISFLLDNLVHFLTHL